VNDPIVKSECAMILTHELKSARKTSRETRYAAYNPPMSCFGISNCNMKVEIS